MRRLFLAIGALALAACARGARVELDAPEVLSASTDVGAAPMFALSPDGARTIAWVSAPGGGTDGRLFVTTNGSPPVELRDSLGGIEPHGEAPPKIGYAPDGTLYALYAVGKVIEGRRFPFTTLRLAKSTDRGATWSPPQTVTGDSVPGSRNFHALHVAVDGSIYVAWLEAKNGQKSATYLTRSTDRGATWNQAVRVASTEACPCCRTAIATAGDGTLYLAWRTVMPGNVRDIVVASSKDHGASWSQPERVHADDFVFEGCPHAGPSMLVDGEGRVHIAWWTGREKGAGVYYARSTDGARSFGEAIPLGVADFAKPAHVQLAIDGSQTVIAAWDDGRTQLPRVMLRVSRDGGASFGEEVVASADGIAATFPVLTVSRGAITLGWAERSQVEHEHTERGKMDMKDPKMQMPLPSVGAQQIIVRRGLIS